MSSGLTSEHYRAMRVRLVAELIARDGEQDLKQLRTFLRQHGVADGPIPRDRDRGMGSSSGSQAGMTLRQLMRPLLDDEVVERTPDGYRADIATLVDWLSDVIEDDYQPLRWTERGE